MNYNEAIEYIHSTPKFARILGNDLLRALLDKLNNPQNNLRFVHIAGTNGKGSCAVMLAEILKNAGFKVGLFTSPYITRFNERIRINGEQISDLRLGEITELIKHTIEEYNTPVSEFALDTAIAFKYFADENCDIVVLETGLGGRLDATNVIETPCVSVIMSIGFDHMQYLGETLQDITAEKCGIIKNSRPTVVYPALPDEALRVIKRFCIEKSSKLVIADFPDNLNNQNSKNAFRLNNKTYELSLMGDFQACNASTVISVINELNNQGFKISDSAVQCGLLSAQNPARFERLSCGLIIDGAHNAPAAAALTESLKKLNRPIILCVAMMSDKDISGCVAELSTVNPQVIVTEIPMPRCQSAEKLAEEFKKYNIDPLIERDPIEAAQTALLKARLTDGEAVVCGSLYLAAEIRKYFTDRNGA